MTQTILTSKVDFELNKEMLQLKYQFLIVKVLKDHFGAFHQFLARNQIVAITTLNKAKYLCMVPQGIEIIPVEFLQVETLLLNEARDAKVFDNHLLNLLLNQQGAGIHALSMPSTSPDLIIVKPKWVWTRTDGSHQCHGLAIKVSWQHDLTAQVETFTETNAIKPDETPYRCNERRQQLYRYQPKSGETVYVRGNHTQHRNQIQFLMMNDVAHFEKSKVGIMTQLVENLNRNCREFFKVPVTFRESRVTQFRRAKLPQPATAWQKLSPTPLNLYALPGDGQPKQLAEKIYTALAGSELIKKAKLKLTLSESAKPGFNLQVLRDHRLDDCVDDYEVGDSDKIIQHLTVEKFAGDDLKPDDPVNWQPNTSGKDADAATDPALIKLAQELLVRQDLAHQQLTSVAEPLIAVAQAYAYYAFNFLSNQAEPEVLVVRLKISQTGALTFDQHLVDLNHIVGTDIFSRLCAELLPCLHWKKKAYFWNQVACVIERDQKRYLFLQTDRTTMPNGKQIKIQLQKSNLAQQLTRETVLRTFDELELQGQKKPELLAVVKRIKQLTMTLGPVFKLSDLDTLLRANALGPRNSQMKWLNHWLEQNAPFTFKDTLQRKLPDSPVSGMTGIGLTQIDDEWDYYVGAKDSLKRSVDRANVLRQIYPLAGTGDADILENFGNFSKLMSVEFVRNGQYTVVPFLVKYLREYWLMAQRLQAKVQ